MGDRALMDGGYSDTTYPNPASPRYDVSHCTCVTNVIEKWSSFNSVDGLVLQYYFNPLMLVSYNAAFPSLQSCIQQ